MRWMQDESELVNKKWFLLRRLLLPWSGILALNSKGKGILVVLMDEATEVFPFTETTRLHLYFAHSAIPDRGWTLCANVEHSVL